MMNLYNKLLNNKQYIITVQEIEQMKFITDGKWDWEHGLGHYKRVASYVEKILTQLNADKRTIDLGMTCALLHDIGLSKGDKLDHALESSKIFTKYIDKNDFSLEEIEIVRQAILDHSKGDNIQSLIGLALVLADKLDITYHRTIHSSIQDVMNKEIQKIKKVDIIINDKDLIVQYFTEPDFDVSILKNWIKAITIPQKAASYLNRNYILLINNQELINLNAENKITPSDNAIQFITKLQNQTNYLKNNEVSFKEKFGLIQDYSKHQEQKDLTNYKYFLNSSAYDYLKGLEQSDIKQLKLSKISSYHDD